MRNINKKKMQLLQQVEQLRRVRPDVYDLLMEVIEEAMTLPENKRAEFIKKATPILLKHIR